MSRFLLSPSAELDLDEIDLQTIEVFGFSQAWRTATAFRDALQSLADEPGIGHRREGLDPPGWTFRYFTVLRRFVIVYQPSTEGIRVARILDGSRDLPGLLGDPDPSD